MQMERAPWGQAAASLAPFAFIGLLMCLPNLLNIYIDGGVYTILFFLAMLVAPLFFGARSSLRTGQLQAWFLPQAGFILGIVSFLLSLPMLFGWFQYLPYALRIFYTQGASWWVIILLVVVIAFAFWHTRFQAQLRDWTLLSFLVYGTVLWGIYFAFGDYPVKDVFYLNYFFYLLVSALVMACGALLYMRSRKRGTRLFWLVSCATLAIAVMAGGKTAMILAGGFLPMQIDWVNELNHSLAAGFWMLVALVFPVVLGRLVDRGKGQVEVSS